MSRAPDKGQFCVFDAEKMDENACSPKLMRSETCTKVFNFSPLMKVLTDFLPTNEMTTSFYFFDFCFRIRIVYWSTQKHC